MNPRFHKAAAIAGALTIASGAGIGAAQAASQSKSGSSTSSSHRHGPGPRGADFAALAKDLGVTEARLRAAMDKVRPAKPAKGEGRERGADLAAALAKALGVETSAVQEILDANRPERAARQQAGAKPAKPDHTKLIKALAEGLDKSEAEVEAAFEKAESEHRAEHEARHAAFAAALAKELGLSTEKVQAALEANRPDGGHGRGGPRP